MFFRDVITYSLSIINDQSGRIVGIAKNEQIWHTHTNISKKEIDEDLLITLVTTLVRGR